MFQSFIVFFFVVLLLSMATNRARLERSDNVASYTITAGQNINDYGTVVSNWAKSNPGYTGFVNDASLNLPSWVSHPGNISNYVVTGTSYIYYTPVTGFPSNRLVTFLSSKGNEAGINASGTLYNGTALVGTAPGAIPNGSVVLVL